MNCYIKDYIKRININLKKIPIELEIKKNTIQEKFDMINYKVQYVNIQNNSINGVIKKGKSKYFFKILKEQEFINEIVGYIEIKDTFPVNKIIEIFEFKNYYISIYEYEKTIGKNKGLLNDFFVENDIKIEENSQQVISNIINVYKDNFNTIVEKDKYPMEKFFKDRVETRLKRWYNNEELLKYTININGIESKSTMSIIEETISFFEKKQNLKCSLTQGDPNTLNIGIKPIFFDFATAGNNPIIAEFSTIFWSVLIADAYFCPKYHSNSYYRHEKVYDNIEKFKPNIGYKIDNKTKKIHIQSNIKTSKIRMIFIKEYINMLKNLNIEIQKEVIYFFTMRILCVFDIRTMDENDYFYSIFILHYLYKNLSYNIYESIINIMNKFENI